MLVLHLSTNKGAAMEAVLGDEYTQEVIYENAYACHILDKRKTSAVVRELTTHLPFPQWLHLKRVKSDKNNPGQLSVLLCPCPMDLPVDSTEHLSVRELCPAIDLPPDDILGPTFVVRIPKFPPLTREQFRAGSAMWPTTFHEDKNITRLLSGEILNEKELSQARSYMAEAFTAATKISSKDESLAGCCDGCCVVDPATNKVLVSARSMTGLYPLHHAVMVAIDLVAKQQGGGVYEYPDDQVYLSPSHGSEGCDESLPYLCTGYDLYATSEPCVLCAMSLVHSRIRRVFYSSPSPDGALGTKYKIHVQAGLNHHYEVYRGLTPATS